MGRDTKIFYELFMSGKSRLLLTAAILAVKLVEADWSDPMDRAQLLLNGTKFSNDLILWQNNEECHHCRWIRSRDRKGNVLPALTEGKSFVAWVDVKWRQRFVLAGAKFSMNHEDSGNASTRFHRFYEGGVYTIDLGSKDTFYSGSKGLSGDKPDFAPIWVTFLIFLGCQIAYTSSNYFIAKRAAKNEISGDQENPAFEGQTEKASENKSEHKNGENPSYEGEKTEESKATVTVEKPKAVKKERLKSLDTFRGICLTIMMFVNYGGGRYWFFDHAKWHGLTVADLVMPWFMFMMGVSFTFSMKSMIRRGFSKYEIFHKMAIRALKLFVLGLFIVNGNNDWATFRVPGVLQRFFICYVVVGGLHAFVQPDLEKAAEKYPKFIDIIPYWPQWLVIFGLEIIWLALTFAMKVPGCPTGYLGPGGLHENGNHWNCSGGAAGYIDYQFFGEAHIYDEPTSLEVFFHDEYYFGGYMRAYDPEGLLGSINSIVIVFLGLQLGKILQFYPDSKSRAIRFCIWGGVLVCIGGGLTGVQQWDGPIPVCKNLWTITFVMVMAGAGFFVLLFLYHLVDVWKIWEGAPFYFVGMNSILIYLLHEILEGQVPFCGDGCEGLDNHAKNMASQVGGVTVWVCYLYYLHRKKFYVVL